MTTRRALLFGLGAVVASPAIVRVSSLMALPKLRGLWTQLTPEEIYGDIQTMLYHLMSEAETRTLARYERETFYFPTPTQGGLFQ